MVTYSGLRRAKQALSKNIIDGVIYARRPGQTALLFNGDSTEKASLVVNAVNAALVRIYAHKNFPQIKLEVSGPIRKASSLALPLWLIQIILTICLLQNSATIAEEKARHTLHSLLVTPVTLSEYFASKVVWSSILGIISLLVTILLTRFAFNPGYLLSFGLMGCIVYSSAALLIGILAPNALFARTVSTTFYLISALPLMIKNSTLSWKKALEINCERYIIDVNTNACFGINGDDKSYDLLIQTENRWLVRTGWKMNLSAF
jgi:ABC-type multidrug transport system permease subunit